MYYSLSLAILLLGVLITAPLTAEVSDSASISKNVDVGAYFIFADCTKHEWQIEKYQIFVAAYTRLWFGNGTTVYSECYDFTDSGRYNIWLNFFRIEQHEITVFLVDNRVPHTANWLGIADLDSGITHVQISSNATPDSKILSHELAHQLAHKKYNDFSISYSWVHCMADNNQYKNMTIGNTPFYYIKPYDGSKCKHADESVSGIAKSAPFERYLNWRIDDWEPRDDYDLFLTEMDYIANCSSWKVLVPNNLKEEVEFKISHIDGEMRQASIQVREDTEIQYCTPDSLFIAIGMLIFHSTNSTKAN